MKKYLFPAAMMLAACGLIQASFAEDAKPVSPGTSSASTPTVQTLEGTVTSCDAASASPWIKVKDTNGQEWTFQIDRQISTVWKAGAKTEWPELRPGDRVNVRYTSKDGKSTVKTVEVA